MVWVLDVENGANLLLSSSSGGCCQADDSCVCAKLLFNHLVQDKISWTEVVRPFTGTVDLIDTHHRNLPAKFAQIFHKQPLWCDKKNFDVFLLDCFHHSLLRNVTLLRVKSCSWDKIRKFLKLVCHKRYQWSHNKYKSRQVLGYKLVA
jgi:hypothetical protein